MSDWLAVGDETGNWDELHNPGAFLGVALVMGRIEDWQTALEERLDDQRIQDRLQAAPRHLPPAHLPPDYCKTPNHHLMDVFNYWQSQKLAGDWFLAAPGDDPLRQEVFATLRWLAEHPRLITWGLWFKGAALQRELFRSGDQAVALGRAYGLLAALALPFLNPADRLLVQPGLRSERPNTLASTRGTLTKDQNNGVARVHGDTHSTISVLEDETQRHRDAWRGDGIARMEAGTLDHLRKRSKTLKNTFLPNKALNAAADLGAGLLRLTCQAGTRGIALRRDETWRNVVFHTLPEVTA
jgi:hypothetical protein